MTAPSLHPDRNILISRLLASGQWARLLEVSREWLAEDPENGLAHRTAAQALVNLDRKAEAELHLRKALAAQPGDPFTHRLMAIVQFDLKNYSQADRSIHEAIELDPRDAQNWYHLAWMCYRQKDLKNGLKWVTKARELEPRNPHILNLYALCADQSYARPDLLLEVLALDPENAFAHNNLGVYYLRTAKDFAKAEQCFRQALTLQPTLKVARSNLFQAVKRRDPIYRVLCAPRDFLFNVRNALVRDKKGNILGFIVGIVIWLFLARFVIIGLVLWVGLVWPLVKFYEFLVIGDMRKKAGEVGATRGGFLGYRRWSTRIRLTLFCAALVAFWTSIALIFRTWAPSGTTGDDTRLSLVALGLGAGLLGLMVIFLVKLGKGTALHYHSWKRSRRLRKLETSQT
jgi:Flp pilus assembly protein TadD